jgi:hypothetical protein
LPLRGKEVLRISEHCHREVTKTAEETRQIFSN